MRSRTSPASTSTSAVSAGVAVGVAAGIAAFGAGACGRVGARSSAAPVDGRDAGAVAVCPPGSATDVGAGPGAACVAAGVPADACAPGFVGDTLGGCAPVLPADPCPSGTFARPGETACAEVAPCGDAPFPTVDAAAADVVYVDAAAVGSAGAGAPDGSRAHPWTAITDAVAHAVDGATIAVAAGTYDAPLQIRKALTIVGRCPRLVEITAGGTNLPTFAVISSHLVLRDLSISNTSALANVIDVKVGALTLSRTWLRTGAGIFGMASDIDVEDALFDHHAAAIDLVDGHVVVHRSVFNGVAGTLQPVGVSLVAPAAAQSSGATLDVALSVFERESTVVTAEGRASIRIDATFARGTAGAGSDAVGDDAAGVHGDEGDLVMRRSVLQSFTGVGVGATAGTLLVEASTLRDFGNFGVYGAGGDLQMTVRSSSIREATSCGVAAVGVSAAIDRVAIAAPRPGSGGAFGICAFAGGGADQLPLDVRGADVRGGGVGVFVEDAVATIADTKIADIVGSTSDGYGDGVDVVAYRSNTSLTMLRTSISSATRAGLAIFGATASLGATSFRDCGLDIDAEDVGARASALDDLGGNVCAGESGEHVCAAESAQLQPPTALPGAP